MKPADLLYSVPGRARRGNTERTTKESGPPGQESSGREAQGSSDFVHRVRGIGEEMGMQKRVCVSCRLVPLTSRVLL